MYQLEFTWVQNLFITAIHGKILFQNVSAIPKVQEDFNWKNGR